jgi:Niemann-Pick C1 protein
VIARELLSDLGLSTLCVFITTTIFIGHFVTSFTVLIIVVVCMAEVIGFMHFWGLTVETVSCIILTISTGLVVDYRYADGRLEIFGRP